MKLPKINEVVLLTAKDLTLSKLEEWYLDMFNNLLMNIPNTEEEVIKIYSTYTMNEILESEMVTILMKRPSKLFISANKTYLLHNRKDFVDINILLNTIKCLNEIKSILYGKSYMKILERENEGFHVKVDWNNYIVKKLKDFDNLFNSNVRAYGKYYPCLPVFVRFNEKQQELLIKLTLT